MATLVAVKEEDLDPGDDEAKLERGDDLQALELLGDPVPVPPGVVLDKLSSLLSSGRVLLRFDDGKKWGVNGKLFDKWCSFRASADAACRFVDDA
ncbi:unnamed protein product, partial [Polarella glacialis]